MPEYTYQDRGALYDSRRNTEGIRVNLENARHDINWIYFMNVIQIIMLVIVLVVK